MNEILNEIQLFCENEIDLIKNANIDSHDDYWKGQKVAYYRILTKLIDIQFREAKIDQEKIKKQQIINEEISYTNMKMFEKKEES